ncbi:cytosine permease [Caldibacillus sp. 210928-DFI.2.22]|uniref:purine-cytosine permease family protein n=1 Tax=Caldibacillus TaxID=1276290 RepID=UPI001D076124|nr:MULTISPECIES: cytosine permease [Caldibacillus]MCB7069135.1 cytosine permease [Caldibacillus sp. 210928-DFI.2.22]MCB7072502.1 cytosine permease [Caldibacillus sp. 210928-DFI.2.18]MCM3797284.1 cytosine permease [Caldibacillus thermoamylovorans]
MGNGANNKAAMGDDYSLTRVPMSARQSLWSITIVRVGALATISQFILGASLGYGMTFWQAFWATMFGSVILQVISFLLGYAGAREGLSTSLLSRWTGFGRHGSSIIGAVIAISCIGWFGVQNSVFANGIVEATGGKLSLPVAATITGLGVTVLVIFGFKLLSITATITVPLFLLAVGYGIFKVLKDHSIIDLMSASPAGEPMSMGAAATMVAGGFIIGAVITPDFSRFAKNGKDVFWMATIGVLIGELGINMIAVLMALAAKTNDVVSIMVTTSGWFGAFVVILSTVKINNLNLYSSSLGFTNIFDSVFNIKLNRGMVTLVIGVIGTVLSIMGILDHFVGFLTFLGVLVPPIAGIIVVEYFILKTHRKELDESRKEGKLPEKISNMHPVTFIAWIAGFASGYLITIGIPSINSLVMSGLVYYVGAVLVKKYKKQLERNVA